MLIISGVIDSASIFINDHERKFFFVNLAHVDFGVVFVCQEFSQVLVDVRIIFCDFPRALLSALDGRHIFYGWHCFFGGSNHAASHAVLEVDGVLVTRGFLFAFE
jgi:hypothetical protein